jgi:hypothetical protein
MEPTMKVPIEVGGLAISTTCGNLTNRDARVTEQERGMQHSKGMEVIEEAVSRLRPDHDRKVGDSDIRLSRKSLKGYTLVSVRQ